MLKTDPSLLKRKSLKLPNKRKNTKTTTFSSILPHSKTKHKRDLNLKHVETRNKSGKPTGVHCCMYVMHVQQSLSKTHFCLMQQLKGKYVRWERGNMGNSYAFLASRSFEISFKWINYLT